MIRAAAAILCLVSAIAAPAAVWEQPAEKDDVRELLQQIEQIVQAGSAERFLALVADSDRARAQAFASVEIAPGVTRVVIQERDRAPLQGTLPGGGYELMVDVFTELGDRARVATWRLDIRRIRGDAAWRIADAEQITSVEGLYRLSLNPVKQFDARNLRIAGEDLQLTLSEGSVFV